MYRKFLSSACLSIACKNKKHPILHKQDGNIFFALFGAIALVGILGTITVSVMRGPLSTMVEVQTRTQAESEMAIASRLALLEATELASNGDCDGDGFVEPLEYLDAAGAGPTGGGFLPNAVASSRVDPWGTQYGYCAWDAGGVTNNIACDTDTSGTNERLDGNASPTDETYSVIAIISAGPDQTFNSSCAGGATPSLTKAGDDIITEFTYASATAETGGLWNLKSGDPTTAEITKNLEVDGSASFSGGIDLTGSSAALELGAASLLFPTEGSLVNCNVANNGLIRINTSLTPDGLELCDSSVGWIQLGEGLWEKGAGDDIYYDDGTAQVGIGNNSPSEALDVTGNIAASGNITAGSDITATGNVSGADISASGNATITGTLGVTGTSNLGTLNASGAVDFDSSLNVDGATTLVGTLDAQGNISDSTGDLTIGDNLVVTGTSDLQGDITNSTGNVTIDTDTEILGSLDVEDVSVSNDLTVDGTVSNPSGNLAITDDIDVTGAIDATGDIDGSDITASGDINSGTVINVNGDQLGPAMNCSATQKLEWNNGTGWSCVTDLQGGAGGGTPALDDLTNVDAGTPSTGDCIIYNNTSGEWEAGSCSSLWTNNTDFINYETVRIYKPGTTLSLSDSDQIMFFDADKLALRGGNGGGGGTDWDEANIGDRSIAWGTWVLASGSTSFAMGAEAHATGNRSFAFGNNVLAGGWDSIAAGNTVTADGSWSVALGYNNTDNNRDWTYLFGRDLIGDGPSGSKTAIGNKASVSATYAMALGVGNSAGTTPDVSASNSLGIFMGDQSAVDMTTANTMAILGGKVVIDAAEPATQTAASTGGEQDLELDVAGDIGADHYCDADGNNCTAATDLGGGLWTDLTGGRIHYGTTSANQVGVGTANPQTTLDVNGGLRVGSVSGGAAPTFMNLNDLGDVSASSPTNGDCIIYNNGTGNWESGSCASGSNLGIFEVASNIVRMKSTAGDYTNDDFVFGSPQLDDDGDANHDARMFFDKSKSAFRAGQVDGTQWDDANIGDESVAFGLNNTASGTRSFVSGFNNTASGTYSIALGNNLNSTGQNSMAWGNYVNATGQYSTAGGATTVASGIGSFAIGEDAIASGDQSFAFGLGDATGTGVNRPTVSGTSSFGIFMGDQTGLDLTDTNTMSLMGGELGIGTLSPSEVLQVEGSALFRDCTYINKRDAADQCSGSHYTFATKGQWNNQILHTSGAAANNTQVILAEGTQATHRATFGFDAGTDIAYVEADAADLVLLPANNVGIGSNFHSGGDTIESMLHIQSGDIRLDGGEGNEAGCIRYNDTSDELEFSDDCSTFTAMNSAGSAAGVFEVTGAAGSEVARSVNTNVPHTTSDFVFGSPQLDDDGNTNHDSRFFFDKSQSAFRAGLQRGNSWDSGNIGQYSTAFGRDPTASGNYSFAVGETPNATGRTSVVMGAFNTGSGDFSVAIGRDLTASGEGAMSLVKDVDTTGDYSMGIGLGITAGADPIVSGNNSLGIFMGDQSGVDLSDANTVSIMGATGGVGIGTAFPNRAFSVAPGSSPVFIWHATSNSAGIGTLSDAWSARMGSTYLQTYHDDFTIDAGFGDSVNHTFTVRINSSDRFSVDETDVVMDGTGALTLTRGTTAQRPGTGVNGMIRYNSTTNKFEGYENGAWTDLAGGSSLWTDNTTHITREDVHILNSGTTMTAAGFDGVSVDGVIAHTDKRALRTGNSDNGAWNEANIGSRSFGAGKNPWATASDSVAMGWESRATAGVAIAMGSQAYATGENSLSFGRKSTASGRRALAIGLGDATGAAPVVSGDDSLGIFMGDQSGIDVTGNNIMSIMGGNVGIGTVAPDETLTINASDADFSQYSYGNTPQHVFYRANGTEASPTGVNDGDYIGLIDFYGHQSGTGYNNAAYMGAVADGNAGAGQVPMALVFGVAYNFGAGKLAQEKLRIDKNGRFGFKDRTADAFYEFSLDGSTALPFFMISTDDDNDGDVLYIGSNSDASFGGTGGLKVHSGTTAQRPGSPDNGTLRYNSTTNKFEGYENGAWTDLASSGSSLWTDNTTHITRGNTHILDAGETMITAGFDGTTPTGMIYYTDQQALRMGIGSFSRWDEANIGNRSFAVGSAEASGSHSVGMGQSINATGNFSFAAGDGSQAGGTYAVAIGGGGTTADGVGSFATGYSNTASGSRAIAMGNETTASGDYAVALGLGDATGTAPIVSGNSSLGIFMGDQSGVDITQASTMAIMGGNVGINITNPDDTLDVVGTLGLSGTGTITTGGPSSAIPLTLVKSYSTSQADILQIESIDTSAYGDNGDSADIIFKLEGGSSSQNGSNAGRMGFLWTDAVNRLSDFRIQTGNNNALSEAFRITSSSTTGIGDFSADTIESTLHIQFGDLRLDGGAGNEAGCIRFDDTADQLQYSDDCSTFSAFSAGGSSLWTDNTTHITRGNIDLINAGETVTTAGLNGGKTGIMYHNDKAAMRIGTAATTEWDESNIGTYSFAVGQNATASGYNAIALGLGATANGNRSLAFGQGATASNNNNIAMGRNVTASGNEAMAIALGTATGTHPSVTGANSLGIFLGDQSGVNLSQTDTMALIGGKLGIGTITPTGELDVITQDNSTDTIVRIGSGANSSSTASSILQFRERYDGSYARGFDFRYNGSAGDHFAIETLNSGGTTEILRILRSNGYMGLGGTTNPQATLHLGGTGALTDGIAFGDGDSGLYESADDIMRMNLGGTDRWIFESSRLFTNTGSGPSIAVGSTPNTPNFLPRYADTDTGLGRVNATDDTLGMFTGGNPTLIIDATNNIGIGGDFTTDTIESQLHIAAGDLRLDGGVGNEAGCIRFDDTTDQLQYSDDCTTFSAFSAGSGASVLNDLTDVYTDYTTEDNLIIGRTGAAALTAGARNNIFIGELSGATSGNSTATTDYNTSVGYLNLFALTSGNHNASFGYGALNGVTSGTGNTAIGSGAGTNVTTTSGTTAIGYNALREAGNNPGNTALGYSAGGGNGATTSITTSTLLGYNAGKAGTGDNLTISASTLVGYDAGGGGNTGDKTLTNSVIIGASAGTPNTSETLTTTDMVVIGNNTLDGNTTVAQGVVIGFEAGDVLDGDNNTLIGYRAGNSITTGSDNILIGHDVDTPAATTSNYLNIGNLIHGDLTSSLLGIGDFSTDTIESSIHVANGDIRLDGGAGNEAGCIRFNDTTDQIEFSDDCTNFLPINAAGAQEIDSLADAKTDYTTDHNMFLGFQNGANVASGAVGNIGLGEDTLDALTTGDNNVAIGYQSLGTVTTAFGNVAIGRRTMNELLNNGGANIAIGSNALRVLDSGYDNTAVGDEAFEALDGDRSGNTGLGNNVGKVLTAGNNNTFLGSDAGEAITTGSRNIFIGDKAADGQTSGDDNILIGQNIELPNLTGSDQLNIGNLIYGDLANGEVGIGATSPDSQLHIVGNVPTGGQSVHKEFTAAPSGAGTTYGEQIDLTSTDVSGHTLYGVHVDVTSGASVHQRIAVYGQAAGHRNEGGASDPTQLSAGVKGVGARSTPGVLGYNSTASGTGYTGTAGLYGVATTGNGDGVIGKNSSGVNGSEAAGVKGWATGLNHSIFAKHDANPYNGKGVIGGHADALTSGNYVVLKHDTSTYTSAGILLDFADGSSGSFTGDFVDFQNSDVTQFSIDSTGDIYANGELRLDGGVGNEAGCIRFNDTTDQIEYSNDCSAYSTFGGGSGVFEVSSNVVRGISGTVNYATDDFVFGSSQLADTGDANHDNRMFFDKSKGAFRAGRAQATQWDDASIGNYSAAFGTNTVASGENAFAVGGGASAANDNAIAFGSGASASAAHAFAIGDMQVSNHGFGVALGFSAGTQPNVSGANSIGLFMGDQSGQVLSSANTMALMGGDIVIGSTQLADTGTGNEDSRMFFDISKGAIRAGTVTGTEWDDGSVGTNSAAFGYQAEASGTGGFAAGSSVSAGASSSIALGNNAYTQHYAAVSIGVNNTVSGARSVSIGDSTNVSGTNSMAIGLGQDAGTRPVISGDNSFGILMGDQSGVDLSDNNTVAIMGATGGVGIGTVSPNASGLHIDTGGVLIRATDGANAARFLLDDSAGHAEMTLYSGAQVDTVKIDSTGTSHFTGGNVGIGTDAPSYTLSVTGDDSDIGLMSNSASDKADMRIIRSRGTETTPTAVAADDALGGLQFMGYDGTAYERGAQISAYVDTGATVADEDMPTHLRFETRSATDTSGVERMRLDSDGHLGIGTTAPDTPLTIDNASGDDIKLIAGNTNKTARLDFSSPGDAILNIESNNNGAAGSIDISSNGDIKFFRNTTEAVHIDTVNQRIGIGNTSPSVALDVTGDIEYTGTITDVSDQRLKENITPLNASGNVIDRITQIDTYSFTMKDDEKQRTEFGVMAQELEKIFPELVHTANDEMGTKSVNYVGLIAPVIEASKELKAENDILKFEISELKAAQAQTNKSLTELSKQVALLNKVTSQNIGNKASMESYMMLILGLIGGGMFMMIIQRRKTHNG